MVDVSLGSDGVGELVLNRPDKRNALSRAMCRDVARAVERLAGDPACRGILLRAEGAVFTAGADMSEPPVELDPAWHWDASESVAMYTAVAASPVPVVGAVESLAVGLGIGLLAQATFVVASERAEFWLPEVTQGFFPYGAVQGMARRVAPEVIVEWALSSSRVTAAAARRERLVTHLVEAGEAVARARELILAITPAGRALVAEALRLLRFGAVAGGSAAIEAWCSERMTADVVKRRAAGSP